MNLVRFICLSCLLGACATPAAGQAVAKCFRAEWLQGARVVRLRAEGGKVWGTFVVEGGDGSEASYDFSGRREGDRLTVEFAGDRLPDLSPSEMRSPVWTLTRRGGRELLRVKLYGKNYRTNRYEENFADFEPCEAGPDNPGDVYAALARKARVVRFARGATSAGFRLDTLAEFQAMKSPAAFLVNAAANQSLEVRADGCVVEIYLPGGKRYEYVEWEQGGEKSYAGSKIDGLSVERLPLSGDYLVVVRKPSEAVRPLRLTITVKR